jgi:hypothetical protein
MVTGYLACPLFSLFCLYLNRHTAAIADQVVMVMLRTVSEQAFPCIYKGISQTISHEGVQSPINSSQPNGRPVLSKLFMKLLSRNKAFGSSQGMQNSVLLPGLPACWVR